MKEKLLFIAIPALFITSSAMAAVEGETSTINFTGNVVEDTCSLSGASKNQTVDLGDVSVNSFSGAGTTTVSKPFSITLDGCSTGTYSNASITFNGETETSSATTLVTDNIGTTNVGIQILQNDTPLSLDGSAASDAQTLADGDGNEMKFAARYVAVNADVAAGTANGTANFTVNYQ
ncbi:type 1 fimbrial protein [Citrobacter amalonaticus]|uniref:fimbrial protein n=1 Tax=Citrobacter amalonaticus TaxID=35703 RepID=UPI0019068858|nr:fimbrial protein [Citrobacter amalonaticus]MBJ9260673.1 type 1 fimbrial protein [Citrobacter amalonaticus]